MQRTRRLTTSVTYVRGAQLVEVAATIARTMVEADDGHVFRDEFNDRDFLVLAADLVRASHVTPPACGHPIREGPRAFDALAGRDSGPQRVTLRITTEEIGTTET